MALLLGEDGRGYELARRLEGCGAWRAWLGDAAYSAFAHSLASPATWEAFLSSSAASSKAQIHLQLRARALLYDKASVSLFLRPQSSASASISNINPNYLQLHCDDIFFSLEDDQQDSFHHQISSRPAFSPGKANEHSYERASSFGSRYNENENVNASQRQRHEDLPGTWYNQYVEKYRTRYNNLPYGDKESNKRTSEGMSAYLKLCQIHKKKRQAFKEDQYVGTGTPMLENGSCLHPKVEINNPTDEEITLFPEIMFSSNCIPESALPLTDGIERNQKIEVYGVLDNLPTVITRSQAMMERFGIKPDYVKMGSKYRGKDGGDRQPLSKEQASMMTNKVVARILTNAGFEGGSEVSIEVFSEIFSSHICKLGRILKILTDSYKKQFSAIELLKMFLQTAGYSNLGKLMEIMKDNNKGILHQTQQNVRAVQSQQQNPLLQAQHFQRQGHPQMSMLHAQNLTFQQQQHLQQQQQLDKLSRRQASTPRGSVMIMDKDHQPMVDVKMENMMESSQIDGTSNSINRQHLLQLRQQRQQQMAMANLHAAQSGQQQLKQMPSGAQVSQLQPQNAYSMRTPPIKVEAFHELMGGDTTLKHEAEHNKLTSPSK